MLDACIWDTLREVRLHNEIDATSLHLKQFRTCSWREPLTRCPIEATCLH